MNQGVLAYSLAAVVPAVLATGLCVSLCSIQLPDGGLMQAGQPSGLYLPVPGLTNIPVMSAPSSEARIQATEVKTTEDTQSFAPKHVWLAGYFPQIEDMAVRGAQAVIDGIAYDLLAGETDSQNQTTRISIRSSNL